MWAWYCLCHGGRDPRALVAAGVACKAVRIASDLLWSTHVLMVPSLMGPMASRGIEVLAEAFMRPIAERVRGGARLGWFLLFGKVGRPVTLARVPSALTGWGWCSASGSLMQTECVRVCLRARVGTPGKLMTCSF